MKEIEIKFTSEEYKLLLKFLYFSDYCASVDAISAFKHSDEANKLTSLLNLIYSAGDQLKLPKSICFSSVASRIRFSDEEQTQMKEQVENDLENIAQIIFARHFAERDLKPVLEAFGDDASVFLTKRSMTWTRARIYLKEFKKNGIANLRFKLFYYLPDETDDVSPLDAKYV